MSAAVRYASREEALAQNGGVLPVRNKVDRNRCRIAEPTARMRGVYLVRAPRWCAGLTFADSRPQQSQQNRRRGKRSFVLSPERPPLRDYTGSHIGQRLAIVLDGKVLRRPPSERRSATTGVIEGQRDQQDAPTIWR